MAEYRLHCFAQSGNAYKAALMLTLTQCDWEPVFVDFFHGAARTDAFRDLNEMAEVPVLEHAGTVLSQSGVILDYLAGQTGRFGAESEAERRDILRWLLWDNHKGSTQQGTARFMMNFLPEDKRSADVNAFLRGRVRAALATLDRHLDGRDWIVANRPTIADLSACSYLYYPEPFGYDAADFGHVAAWLDRISGLEGWVHPYELMPGA